MHQLTYLLTIFLLFSPSQNKRNNLYGEYLVREEKERTPCPSATAKEAPKYPWEETYAGKFPKITREYFRCKGSPLHPVHKIEKEGKEPHVYRDCSGAHGLPVKDGIEYVYPTLLTLLNYIQEKTDHRVVITSGHCCPEHSLYLDPTPYNCASKHMIGAEVDFYVEGMEQESDKIIQIIQQYYQKHAQKEYREFSRYQKTNLNVSTPAWMNKEIFVKLYLPHEGRDADNQHPYPYLSIQIRFDPKTNAQVSYDPKVAQNFLRY